MHDLEKLIGAAGLGKKLDDEMKLNNNLEKNWTAVKDWNEESRYKKKSESDARGLYSAVTDKKDGVLKWIRRYW